MTSRDAAKIADLLKVAHEVGPEQAAAGLGCLFAETVQRSHVPAGLADGPANGAWACPPCRRNR
jgi:hypothetical protein